MSSDSSTFVAKTNGILTGQALQLTLELLCSNTSYVVSSCLVQVPSVRIFTGISLKKAWARLWYLCRGVDSQGRGVVQLPWAATCQLMGNSLPTLYEWLREGKKAGAFRKCSFRANSLHIWLGGLYKVCRQLELENWGTVVTVPLITIFDRRLFKQAATSACAQNLQEKSKYKAKLVLKERERRCFKIPDAADILNIPQQSFQKLVRGQVAGIIHVSQQRIFAAANLIPYGASQVAIADELNVCDRTVRRHLAAAGIDRKQLVQTKDAYQLIKSALNHEADFCKDDSGIFYTRVSQDEIVLTEPSGISSYYRPGGHRLKKNRFFLYRGRVWLYRCNLYNLDHSLTSMRAARRSYKNLIGREAQNQCPIDKSTLSSEKRSPEDGLGSGILINSTENGG